MDWVDSSLEHDEKSVTFHLLASLGCILLKQEHQLVYQGLFVLTHFVYPSETELQKLESESLPNLHSSIGDLAQTQFSDKFFLFEDGFFFPSCGYPEVKPLVDKVQIVLPLLDQVLVSAILNIHGISTQIGVSITAFWDEIDCEIQSQPLVLLIALDVLESRHEQCFADSRIEYMLNFWQTSIRVHFELSLNSWMGRANNQWGLNAQVPKHLSVDLRVASLLSFDKLTSSKSNFDLQILVFFQLLFEMFSEKFMNEVSAALRSPPFWDQVTALKLLLHLKFLLLVHFLDFYFWKLRKMGL